MINATVRNPQSPRNYETVQVNPDHLNVDPMSLVEVITKDGYGMIYRRNLMSI